MHLLQGYLDAPPIAKSPVFVDASCCGPSRERNPPSTAWKCRRGRNTCPAHGGEGLGAPAQIA
eukprot:6390299-Pyramimonas_sp.AAC.1